MHKASVRLEQLMPIILEQIKAGESVQFTPQGTSMRPTIYGGRDQVVLSALPEKLRKYDLPLYRRDNGQYVLHRILKVGESYTCIGDNQYEYEEGVRQDQMLALATGFIRKGKFHSVDSFPYKCYCRFWHYTRFLRHFWLWLSYGIKRRALKLFKKEKNTDA